MKRILLTGDDGYQSIGTRLVIKALKPEYDLTIAATKTQMSAVGGHVSLKSGAMFGEDVVDGVKAYWTDGYPADAMEFVAGRFPTFDYIISGLNLGANVGPGFPSGTVAAAVHGIALHNAPKAIILSWHVGREYFFQPHDVNESLDDYVEYPFRSLLSVLKIIFQNDVWGANIVNVNFPEQPTTRARITTPLTNLQTFYNYPLEVDNQEHRFTFGSKPFPSSLSHDASEEAGALIENVISITPWQSNLFDARIYASITEKDIEL